MVKHPRLLPLLVSGISSDGVTAYLAIPYAAPPLPLGDQLGIFAFTDAGNPEVFVKVLDWGTAKPPGGHGGYVAGTSMGY